MRRRLRSLARGATVAGLRAVPLAAFEPLRALHAHARSARRFTAPLLSVVRHRPVDARVRDFPLSGGDGVRLANDGSSVARTAYWLGRDGYEPGEVEVWESLCREAGSILELGANVGYFTLHGARANPDAKYVAVEPNPLSAESVRRNLALNGVTNANVLERAVVGDDGASTMELFLPDLERESTATGAYLAGGESIDRPAARSVTVQTVHARELFEGVDLAKLDIEGYEHIVLGAALDIVRESRPTILLEMRRNTVQLRELVTGLARDANYSVLALSPAGPVKLAVDDIATVVLQERYFTRDVLLVPGVREGLLAA